MIPSTSLLRAACIVAILMSGPHLKAQTPGVTVFGTVRDMNTRDSIPFPLVTVEEIGADRPPLPIVSTARGRYEFALTQQKHYVIHYGAPNKLAKSVRMELNGPGTEDWATGYGMQLDITLMDSLPSIDSSVLKEPFGIARFNKESGYYEWDLEYTRLMAERLKALLDVYHERDQRQ